MTLTQWVRDGVDAMVDLIKSQRNYTVDSVDGETTYFVRGDDWRITQTGTVNRWTDSELNDVDLSTAKADLSALEWR